MKLKDLHSFTTLNEQYGDEELRKGYRYGDDHVGDYQNLRVENLDITYRISQQKIHSPERYYSDSPPERRTYIGKAKQVEISEIKVIPLNYDIIDLEYVINVNDLRSNVAKKKFYDYLVNFGNANYQGEDKLEYNQKVLPVLFKDRQIVDKIFAELEEICENVDQYEE